jgi:hypothetical protein
MIMWKRMEDDSIGLSKGVSSVLNLGIIMDMANMELDYLLPNDEVSIANTEHLGRCY